MAKSTDIGRLLQNGWEFLRKGVAVWLLLMLGSAFLIPLLHLPVWAALVSVAIGIALFALAERKVFGYRLIIAMAILAPGDGLGGHDLHIAQISSLLIVATFLAMYARKGWIELTAPHLAPAT